MLGSCCWDYNTHSLQCYIRISLGKQSKPSVFFENRRVCCVSFQNLISENAKSKTLLDLMILMTVVSKYSSEKYNYIQS